MKVSYPLPTFLLAVLLSGCAGSTGSNFVDVTLNATAANRGQTGMVGLVDKGDSTSLNFTIGGVPSGVSLPLQLLSFIYPGSCANLGAQPAYSRNSDTQVFQEQAGWIMSKQAPVSLATLMAGSYAVVVSTSTADGGQNIFCGDIR